MKELFPRAKNVQWKGQVPVIVQTDEPFNSGFKAFLTPEELVMMVKHAEQPQRVSDGFYIFFFSGTAFLEYFCAKIRSGISYWGCHLQELPSWKYIYTEMSSRC